MVTKTVTKKGTYKINLNSKSKDMVYTVDSKVAKGVYLNLVVQSGYEPVFERSGNNLMIYTLSLTGKTITTKITNYYKYYPKNNNFLKINNSVIVTPDIVKSMSSDLVFSSGYYNNNTSSKTSVMGKKGNNYYDLQKKKDYETIYDIGGNDTYNIATNYTDSLSIVDYAGNDKYKFRESVRADIVDFKGNDSYDLYLNDTTSIQDNAGNDKYKIFYTDATTTILDKAGNDRYDIDCSDSVKITDIKGNDLYNLTYTWEDVNIVDKAGNDKYIAIGPYSTTIDDYKGNDSYSFSYAEDDIDIIDRAGNDKYKIIAGDESTTIKDLKGNDKYTIRASYNVDITDTAGADIYNISNSWDNTYITDGKEGSKAGGNDKYTLTRMEDTTSIIDYYGKETYNVNTAEYLSIHDYRLNDIYNISNSYGSITDDGVAEKVGKKMNYTLANDKYNLTNSAFNIEDKSGTDTYKFTYSYGPNEWSYVVDKAGKDTYTAKYTNLVVDDRGTSSDKYTFTSSVGNIIDKAGTDTYNITSSKVTIMDLSASKKDSYTVNALNSKVLISDGGGTGDMLTISSANKNNFIFMVDYSSNAEAGDGVVNSGSLFIFDKTKGGFIGINDFFKKGEGNYLAYGTDGKAAKGTGYLESIKAGKTSVISSIFSYATQSHISAWAEQIGAWLNTEGHSFGSISSLMSNGSDAQIKDFIAYCVDNHIA